MAVGQILTAPEAGWQRFDNLNPLFTFSTTGIYVGPWNTAPDSQAYAGGFAYTYDVNAQVKFNFVGTELRLIANTGRPMPAAISILIDGVECGPCSESGPAHYQVVVFEKLGLTDVEHTVVITAGNLSGGYYVFDAIDIDATGQLKAYNDGPPVTALYTSGAVMCVGVATGTPKYFEALYTSGSVICTSTVSGTAQMITLKASGAIISTSTVTGSARLISTNTDFDYGFLLGLSQATPYGGNSITPPTPDALTLSIDYKNGYVIGIVAGSVGYTQASQQPDLANLYLILNTYDDTASKKIFGSFAKGVMEVYQNENSMGYGKLTIGGTYPYFYYTFFFDEYNVDYDPTFWGVKFIPDTNGNLHFDVISRARDDSQDLNGITLDVENDTNCTLFINVINEDQTNPRFILGVVTGTGPVTMS